MAFEDPVQPKPFYDDNFQEEEKKKHIMCNGPSVGSAEEKITHVELDVLLVRYFERIMTAE